MADNFSFSITLTRDQLEFVRTGLKGVGFKVESDKGTTEYRGITFDYDYVPITTQPPFGSLTLTIEYKSFFAKMLSDSYIESEVRGMVAQYLASMPLRKPDDPGPGPEPGPMGGKAA